MSKRLEEVEEPLSANERFLYAMIQRQDVIIEQLSSIIEYIASKESVATQNNKTEDKPAPKRTARKTASKE